MNVSRETLSKFQQYADLLIKWNKSLNLISKSDLENIHNRHILDSAQLFQYIKNKNISIADLGSGAGLPGIILNIMGCTNIDLIEIDEKKCVFLREVKRQLNLNCTIINADIKTLSPKYQLCISRACADLTTLLNFAHTLLTPDSKCLFLKGLKVDEEILAAQEYFLFEYEKYPSITDQNGVIIEIRKINVQPDANHSN